MKKIKKIEKVWIQPGCLSCGACEFIAPEVFSVEDICYVKTFVDLQQYDKKIRKAAEKCPAKVIKIEEICVEK